MRPYALEGLDCSGKKTIATLVQQHLRDKGLDTGIVIGPLLGGRLGRIDARLANLTTAVHRGTPTDIFRRGLYVAEPVLDGLLHRPGPAPILKVGTHFRAWARAEIENDRWMADGYRHTRPMHVRYAGATLLATDFATRLDRHRADVAAGRTTKVERRRFLGPGPDAFTAWQETLDRLISTQVQHVLHLDSTTADPAELAEHVAQHAMACWEADQ